VQDAGIAAGGVADDAGPTAGASTAAHGKQGDITTAYTMCQRSASAASAATATAATALLLLPLLPPPLTPLTK
jgi:hypothetical protein